MDSIDSLYLKKQKSVLFCKNKEVFFYKWFKMLLLSVKVCIYSRTYVNN